MKHTKYSGGCNTFEPERVIAPRVPGVLEDIGRDVIGVLSAKPNHHNVKHIVSHERVGGLGTVGEV